MNLRNRIAALLLCLLAPLAGSAAAGRLADVLQHLADLKQSGDISFDYRLCLKLKASGKITDSIRGRICAGKDQYADSNGIFLTIRNGDYYCKLDHRKKTAYICDLRVLRAKLSPATAKQLDLATQIRLPDSVLLRHSALSLDSSVAGRLRLTLRSKGPQTSLTQVDMNREDYTITGIYTEEEDGSDGPGLDYLRTYNAHNVQYKTDPRTFDQTRIYTIKAGKATLAPRYASYKLTQLLR